MTEPTPNRPRGLDARGRRTLLLITAVAIAPVLVSYAIYYFFPRDAAINYGTLLPAATAPAIEGTAADGAPFRLGDVKGRWVLVSASDGACDSACERTLHATRQARTMQGKEQDRIVRVWLYAGNAPPPRELVAQHPGLVVVRVPAASLAELPGADRRVWLVDPLGNFVLAYPADPDIKGVAKDLARLLRASRIG